MKGAIGIIATYRKQVYMLSKMLGEEKYKGIVEINTVDSYQGREKDIIIVVGFINIDIVVRGEYLL